MENYGCFNFYNQVEYEPNQQRYPNNNYQKGNNFGQPWRSTAGPSTQQPYNNNFQQDQTLPNQVSQLNSQVQELKDTLNQFMQLTMANQQNITASIKNLETQMRQQTQHLSQISQILANQQGGTFTASGKVIGEGVNDNLTVERKIVENEENEEEDVYGRSDTEEAENVENDEEMKVEWLLIKEESMEERGKKLSKVEIDRVIDEICALFNKPKLGRIWTPHQLYLKFMEFLPKRRSTKDDVLSVSFWPP